MPCGVIGSTRDFESRNFGSTPDEAVESNKMSRYERSIIGNASVSKTENRGSSPFAHVMFLCETKSLKEY